MHTPVLSLTPSRFRMPLLFMVFVLLECLFLRSLDGVRWGNPMSVLVAMATGGPLVASLFLMFPTHALLLTPLCILVPIQILHVHLFECLLLVALYIYALRHLAEHTLDSRWRSIDIVFLLYLGWAAFTTTQAVDKSVALLGLKPYLVFFLAFWTGSRVLGTAHLRTLLRVYAWITIGIALETIGVAIANGIPLQFLAQQMGKFTDLGWGRSNYVAAVAALSAAAVLPLMLYGKGTDRRLAIASLVAAAFVAIVSASRGGTVAVVFSLVLVLTKDRLNVFLTLVALGAVGAFLFFSPTGQEHFLGPKGLPSIGARILFFREALRIAFEHPWTGIGPDQIPYHTYFYMDANPHNIFLKQAADLGVLGLGLYVLLLGWVVKGILALRGAARQGGLPALRYTVLLLVFLTAVTNASYEPTLEAPQYGFLFWLLVGTLLPVERPDDASTA